MCAEHPQTDAGEGDGPQCFPAGHVQEEVRQWLSPLDLLHLTGIVSDTHIAGELVFPVANIYKVSVT